MKVRVLFPYRSYDFGAGLPVITDTGVDLTQIQYDQINDIIQALPEKSQPQLQILGLGGYTPDPYQIQATEGWVLDQIEAGGGGGNSRLEYRQPTPSATWTINHNLGTKPDLVLLDDGVGTDRVYTDVRYPDNNTAVVEWPSPTTGWAYIL